MKKINYLKVVLVALAFSLLSSFYRVDLPCSCEPANAGFPIKYIWYPYPGNKICFVDCYLTPLGRITEIAFPIHFLGFSADVFVVKFLLNSVFYSVLVIILTLLLKRLEKTRVGL